MLNYITPEMIVKAAGLVKQGKVYALGEELHTVAAGRFFRDDAPEQRPMRPF